MDKTKATNFLWLIAFGFYYLPNSIINKGFRKRLVTSRLILIFR